MPEEKKAAEKTESAKNSSQPSKLSKILQWFKTLPQRIAKPFRNMYYELKKVTWPTKQKLINYSVIVLAFMLVMGVVIGLLDMGASTGVRLLIPKNSSAVNTVNTAETAEEAVEETAEEAEGTVEQAAEEAAATVEQAGETVEKAVEETAETVEKAVEETAETVGEAVEKTAETAEEAASGEK